jgi:hypothetical protein
VSTLSALQHLEIQVLDVVDVVVSKLKRFNANGRSDIDAMIGLGRVGHGDLVSRFRNAVDAFAGDARADDLPGYVRNLHAAARKLERKEDRLEAFAYSTLWENARAEIVKALAPLTSGPFTTK